MDASDQGQTRPFASHSDLAVAGLVARLREVISGDVHFDAGTRALYSSDASLFRALPIGVVVPDSIEDLEVALSICRDEDVAVLPRGTGTSLAGQACNRAVILDTRRLNQIIDVDVETRTARVQPGVILDDLQAQLRPHGLTFGPDPSTHNRCTIGGMVGNNACGVHSLAWGKTSDNVEGLETLLYDGTRLSAGATTPKQLERLAVSHGRIGDIYQSLRQLRDENLVTLRTGFPTLPRRVSGYSLDELLPERGCNLARALVGTEGTCAITYEATLRLVRAPVVRSLLVLGYSGMNIAADCVPAVLQHEPLGMEGMSDAIIRCLPGDGADYRGISLLPAGLGWLFVEFGGDDVAEATLRAEEALVALRAAGAASTATIVSDPALQRQLWAVREDGSGFASRLPGGREAWSGWEDAAVPPARLGAYLRDFDKLLKFHGLEGVPYGHFGDGCVHIRIGFDLASAQGKKIYRRFLEEAADLVVSFGGSLSGEHGDGQARAELLSRMYGEPLMGAFRTFKSIFDPTNRMNPGKVVHARHFDEDLRPTTPMGIASRRTYLSLVNDGGDMMAASRRCVGVGKCLRPSGGTMCPSYKATGQEQHSTRGRSRLLFEMLAGEVITDGWRSEEVRAALDLCLSCKACRNECPVEVDMASYKSEFLAQHYRRRLRPAAHYSMGYLPVLARLAARTPQAANAVGRAVSRSPRLLRAAGIDPNRSLPRFASERFLSWAKRQDLGRDGASVVLFPDTFTNYFAPEIAQSATRVLNAAGLNVIVPSAPVCCGLTWISTGQLATARRVVSRTLRALEPYLDDATVVIGLEPSCTAALRTDIPELVDSAASRELAARTRTLSAALAELAPEWTPPHVGGRALVQVHCHQQAVLGGFASDTSLLERAGVEVSTIEGCCGLAGNFGFENGHYDISVACAEESLLPALRERDESTIVLADGFSCRTQVDQLAGQPTLHLAQLLDQGWEKRGPNESI